MEKEVKNEGTPLMLASERRQIAVSPQSPRNGRFRVISANQIEYKKAPRRSSHPTTTTPVNTESHHYKSTVKPLQAKRESEQQEKDSYAEMEARLIRSVQITETLSAVVNERIHLAIEGQLLRIPIIGFFRSSRHGVELVYEFSLLEKKYEIQCLNNPVHITEAQLSLDLFHAQKEYSTIVSILIHLQNYTPRLTYIISRQSLAYSERPPDLFLSDQSPSPPPQSELSAPLAQHAHPVMELSFMDRLLLNYMKMTETAYYYMIFIDLALSPYTMTPDWAGPRAERSEVKKTKK